MATKVVIIGAGPGGLTAGMLLARRGFEVEIFEKADRVGGRNAAVRVGEFTFDTGPTFLMMNFILEEMFAEAGRRAGDYLTFRRIEPMYRLQFTDRTVLPTGDHTRMREYIARTYPGQEAGYDEFLRRERVRFEKMFPCLQMPYSSLIKFLHPNLIKALPHLDLGRSLFDTLGRYFSDEKLKLSFTFQAKYLGMSPWECPAAFTMIPFIEHSFGIYHPMGGLFRISEAMAKVVGEHGGRIRLNTPVRALTLDGRRVTGVELDSGERVLADEVVINADFCYAMTQLVPDGVLRKYSRRRIARKRFSCSTFMLYLGLDKRYGIPHHNIFFAEDYRGNVADIFTRKRLSEDTSFYLQNACALDPSLAPAGGSTLYVLVPVANRTAAIDWQREKKRFRELVLSTIERRTELADLRRHIVAEHLITPDDWEGAYNVYNGATFNLAHNLGQMMYFRPHNRFEELDRCWLVGGGTHPGSGLPTIYESGRITANMICKQHRVPFTPPSRLSDKRPVAQPPA
jgi:phytoene desaturase